METELDIIKISNRTGDGEKDTERNRERDKLSGTWAYGSMTDCLVPCVSLCVPAKHTRTQWYVIHKRENHLFQFKHSERSCTLVIKMEM